MLKSKITLELYLIAIIFPLVNCGNILPMFDIRIDTLSAENCDFQEFPSNCAKATACTGRSGYYEIKPIQFINNTIIVECDAHTEGGDWTVIQRRQDGSVDFFRTWTEYKNGFGDIEGEFFIGLDKLYALTNFDGPQELLVLMEKTDLKTAYAKYTSFAIGDESTKYILKRIGNYSGTAGDSLLMHVNCKFTTKDNDNDRWAEGNCAERHLGGWWHKKCHASNLNGHYGDKTFGNGINWVTFSTHDASLKSVAMMIRRRRN